MDLDRALATFERIMATITTPGRKGAAFDRALIGVLGITVLMYKSEGGLSADEGQVAVEAVIWIMGVFGGTNVGEHFAKRGQPAGSGVDSVVETQSPTNVVAGLWGA